MSRLESTCLFCGSPIDRGGPTTCWRHPNGQCVQKPFELSNRTFNALNAGSAYDREDLVWVVTSGKDTIIGLGPGGITELMDYLCIGDRTLLERRIADERKKIESLHGQLGAARKTLLKLERLAIETKRMTRSRKK